MRPRPGLTSKNFYIVRSHGPAQVGPEACRPLKRRNTGSKIWPSLFPEKTFFPRAKQPLSGLRTFSTTPVFPESRHIGLGSPPGRPESSKSYTNEWERPVPGPNGPFRGPLGPGPPPIFGPWPPPPYFWAHRGIPAKGLTGPNYRVGVRGSGRLVGKQPNLHLFWLSFEP